MTEISLKESRTARMRTLRQPAATQRFQMNVRTPTVRRVRILKQTKKHDWRFTKVAGATLVLAALLIPLVESTPAATMAPVPPGLLDPIAIPKFVNQLYGPPPVYVYEEVADEESPSGVKHVYTVDATQFRQQILPLGPIPGLTGDGMTTVWGYGGEARDALTSAPLGYVPNSPGPSFEAVRGTPVEVKWVNNLVDAEGKPLSHLFAVDPTLHWARMDAIGMPEPPYPAYPPGFPEAQTPVPIVTHLHGAEVQSTSDGGPDAWFTPDGEYGAVYDEFPETMVPGEPGAVRFTYPNAQPATTLWYHDHALGITRINVMSGLAGFYLLRDEADMTDDALPSGKYEMPIVIQDRTFKANGEFFFDSVGINPEHPYWLPEFFGNTIMVNGKVWPNMDVDKAVYRFRLLDGSNARFYTLQFWDKANNLKLPFTQIGSDGGYLRAPVTLTQLTIAPGERADIIVDFSNVPAGTKILMSNTAKAPFPGGAIANPKTVGQIMQFTVKGPPNPAQDPVSIPATLNPTLVDPATGLGLFPTLTVADKTRTFTLVESMGPGGPLEILLNGQKWMGVLTEEPFEGATEDWIIVNPTADTHPIHLHLTQFQLISRQKIDAAKYYADWLVLNKDGLMPGMMEPPFDMMYEPSELPIGPYLKNKPMLAPPNEQGWKDTVQMNPGEVTIIRVKFAPIDGSPAYPFDPTYGPGYVWHCHIIDHEDNEMMRPYVVAKPA